MDTKDRQRIYALLSKFFPNAKQLKDKETLTAWGLALELFAYEDVKQSVIRYAIANKYFPDLADITGGLRPTHEARPNPSFRAGSAYRRARHAVLDGHGLGWAAERILGSMPPDARLTVERMGGLDAFAPPDKPLFEFDLFHRTYVALVVEGVIQ